MFENTNKVNRISIVLLAIAFMFIIFAPIESFFVHSGEIWFSIFDLMAIFIPIFLLCVFIIYIVRKALLKKSFFLDELYAALIYIYMYFYIQGNYIPRNYGVLDGKKIDWSQYNSYNVMSYTLMLILLILILFLFIKCKRYFLNISLFFVIGIVCIQLISIFTFAIQYGSSGIREEESSKNLVVSDYGSYTLSKEKNIIVLILDTFESSIMRDLIENGDDKIKSEVFDGFTYFPDTVGMYPTTKGALPHLLTGVKYKNECSYAEYLEKAYKNNELYKILNEQNYSIGVYTSNGFLDESDQSRYINVRYDKYIVNDKIEFAKTYFNLLLFNYMPNILKKHFVIYTGDFDKFKSVDGSNNAFGESTVSFYKNLLKQNLSNDDDKKSFRFYHLDGIHPPATFDENLVEDDSEMLTEYDEAKGNITLLKEYFKQLKELSIYDNSVIYIMADHGYMNFSQNPLFMVKNINERHDCIVSDKKISYDNMYQFMLDSISGKSIDSIYLKPLDDKNVVREFMYYSWDNTWDSSTLPDILRAKLEGKAEDISNMKFTGEVYSSGSHKSKYRYKLGEELVFGLYDKASERILYGFSGTGDSTRWTVDENAVMMFLLDEEYVDLKIKMEYFGIRNDIPVHIFVNGNLVDEFITGEETYREIQIPENIVENGVVLLRFNLPDIDSPLEYGNGTDPRKLGIALKSLSIENSIE